MSFTSHTWIMLPLLLPCMAWGHDASHSIPASLSLSPAFFRAATGATIANVTIDDDKQTYGTGPLQIRYSDGEKLTISSVNGTKRILEATVGFSSPQIGDDKQTVGWIEQVGFCCTSYPLDHIVDVFRGGRVLLHLAVPSMVYDFKILPGSREIVIHSGFPHGAFPETVELFEVVSGRKLGVARTDAQTEKLPPTAPAWAKAYLVEAK